MLVAEGFGSRLVGLRPAPFGWGLCLRAGHLHAVGMATDLVVLSVAGGVIRSVDHLPAGGRLQIARGHLGVEFAAEVDPPGVGAEVELRPILGRWPAD